jgi:hypothetical protein
MPWAEHDHELPLPSLPPARFHPEMGYFAPSPPTRRLMRVGLIAGVGGIALGAIAAFALVPGSRPGPLRVDAPATVGQAAAAATRGETTATVAPATTAKPAPVRVLAPSPTGPDEGSRAALQGATPAVDEIKPAEEPQTPAASTPSHEKTAQVRKKKRSRSRQEEARSAYASPYNGRYEPGTRYDNGRRPYYAPAYPQQQRQQWGNRDGWSW